MIKRTNTFEYIGTPKSSKWIMNSLTHRFNILCGAVRSSKDYNTTIAFIEAVKSMNYDLFLIGAIDVKNAMRIVGRYIIDYLGGLAKRTTYMEAPAISFTYNGMIKTIIFAGGKNSNSDAGIQGLTIGIVYFTEINLLNPDFINQAIKRTSSFADAKIFGTYNPKNERHWFETDFMNIWKSYQEANPDKHWLNFNNFSLYDNPILTDDMIDQIKASYDPNSMAYKRDILGLFADPAGALYLVRDYNILNTDIDYTNYKRYITLIDIGESASSTTFTMAAPFFNRDKGQWELHILREYNHINNSVNEMQKKSSLNYIDDYVVFIKECISLMKMHPEKILFDGTDQFFRDLYKILKQNKLGQHTPKRVTKDKDEDRIYRGQSWLYQGKLKFHKSCTLTIQDYKDAEHDEKVYERSGKIVTKDIFNDDGHMDRLDNVNYASTYYGNLIK